MAKDNKKEKSKDTPKEAPKEPANNADAQGDDKDDKEEPDVPLEPVKSAISGFRELAASGAIRKRDAGLFTALLLFAVAVVQLIHDPPRAASLPPPKKAIAGLLYKADRKPAGGAFICIAATGQCTKADARGYFSLDNVQAPAGYVLLRIETDPPQERRIDFHSEYLVYLELTLDPQEGAVP